MSYFCIWFGFLYAQFLLRIQRNWSRENFAILFVKPRSHVKILIYRTWPIRENRETIERVSLEPGTTGLRVPHPDHSATLPPVSCSFLKMANILRIAAMRIFMSVYHP